MAYPEPIRPSEVEAWTRCPTLWHRQSVQGWQPIGAPFNVGMAMGTALHAGMAAYWRRLSDGEGRDPEVIADLKLGELWPEEYEDHSIEGMARLLEKMVRATIAWCQVHMDGADPLLIERQLGPDGATPDLVTREQGGVVITDYKTHLEVKPENVVYRLQDPEQKHQFQDYTWRVGEYLSTPVRLFRALHIVGLPKIIVREATFVPSEAQQAEWLRQARRKWHLMAMMKVDPALVYRNEGGCKPFGDKYPCPQWTACWECHGDEKAIAQFYTKEEKA